MFIVYVDARTELISACYLRHTDSRDSAKLIIDSSHNCVISFFFSD
jgi:hypothetical protein